MRWPLQETPSADYRQRTRWNVLDSDATLILAAEAEAAMTGGTALTARIARKAGRPLQVVDPAIEPVDPVRLWIVDHSIRTLNVAGPRETGSVEEVAANWLRELLVPFASPEG